jgi:hypothetical protein
MAAETQPSKIVQGHFFPELYVAAHASTHEKFESRMYRSMSKLFAEHDTFCETFRIMQNKIDESQQELAELKAKVFSNG